MFLLKNKSLKKSVSMPVKNEDESLHSSIQILLVFVQTIKDMLVNVCRRFTTAIISFFINHH